MKFLQPFEIILDEYLPAQEGLQKTEKELIVLEENGEEHEL